MIWNKPHKVKFEVKPTKKNRYIIFVGYTTSIIQILRWSWHTDGVVTGIPVQGQVWLRVVFGFSYLHVLCPQFTPVWADHVYTSVH